MFDDRLEVDSPGIFAGGVKKENIRYTHFSRNPRIAAFLKDYDYVKEYGEGVDRMCRELEAIGLPDPTFDNSTFILKTTVHSASFESKTTNYASIRQENASIQQNDASIHDKNALIAKLHQLVMRSDITVKEAYDIEVIISNVDIMQVITSEEVMKIIACKTTKARFLLKVMEANGLIKAIQGKGKGKYILNISGQGEL
jgi:ATP-dependent DNA helicase RecG